jgi:class 3 adenylate cyclase
MSQTRRLAAILAADVAGYSRLMGVDEEGTHERLKALRREFVDPRAHRSQFSRRRPSIRANSPSLSVTTV